MLIKREDRMKDWKEEFDEEFGDKFFDIGEPNEDNLDAGSEKVFYSSLKKHIASLLSSQLKEVLERLPKENPNYARICQNRNGMDYCGTCEQSWEDCSCSARNRGHNDLLSQVKKILAEVEKLV
jgi:hypothetical protein